MSHDITPAPEGAKTTVIDPHKVGEWIADHVLAHENGNMEILGHMAIGAGLIIALSRVGGPEIESTADIARRVAEGAGSRMVEALTRLKSAEGAA